MKVLSRAKINLMLRILGKREDAYHLLQTYFQLLDWGDKMEFILTEQDTIEIVGNFDGLPVIDNLIYQAAKLLQPYKNVKHGIGIHVDKKIPQGSGLGGGSSNAGTTLRILNTLWKCDLTLTKLQEMATQLGADVPIFVLNHSAMATGIGEKLTPYSVKQYYFVLIFPETSISTADVFNDIHLIRNQSSIDIKNINDQNNWTNACLDVVLEKFPEVNNMYIIASKYSSIYMSGTGSTLFSSFDDQENALRFIKQCPTHWKTQICQSKIIQ